MSLELSRGDFMIGIVFGIVYGQSYYRFQKITHIHVVLKNFLSLELRQVIFSHDINPPSSNGFDSMIKIPIILKIDFVHWIKFIDFHSI